MSKIIELSLAEKYINQGEKGIDFLVEVCYNLNQRVCARGINGVQSVITLKHINP